MNKKLLEKFLQDECSPLEQEEVLSWLNSSDVDQLKDFIGEDLEAEFRRNSEIDCDLSHLLPEILQEDDLNQSAKKHSKDESKGNKKFYRNSSRKLFSRNIKWAASLFLVAVIFYLLQFGFSTDHQVVVQPNEKNLTKSNQRGRKSTIFLKDGTIVYLNSESKITYPDVFSDSLRVVHLEGEAFFEVAKDVSKPFIVQTGPLTVQVLGTSFNVRSFSETDEIKISLLDGQVEVSNKAESDRNVVLKPNRAVTYQIDENSFSEITRFDPDEDIGWKEGILYFKKAGFISVIKRLEMWYNVQFDIKNDPRHMWSYTGEFQNQNLENVLRSIGFSQGFLYEINKDSVIIKFK